MQPTDNNRQIAAMLMTGLRCGTIASRSAARTPPACQPRDNDLGDHRRTRKGMQNDAPMPAMLVTVIALPRAITSKPNTSARYGPPQEVRNVPPTDIATHTGINVHKPLVRAGVLVFGSAACDTSSKGFSSRRRTKKTTPSVASSIIMADNAMTGRQPKLAVPQL